MLLNFKKKVKNTYKWIGIDLRSRFISGRIKYQCSVIIPFKPCPPIRAMLCLCTPVIKLLFLLNFCYFLRKMFTHKTAIIIRIQLRDKHEFSKTLMTNCLYLYALFLSVQQHHRLRTKLFLNIFLALTFLLYCS